MKRILALFLMIIFLITPALAAGASATADVPQIKAPSAILVERSTGTILYEKNAHEILHPASVTKIMTMLLTMEAVESGFLTYDTVLTVSEHAAQMGGSQVFLEPGEQMTLHEALKCIAVSSANDACVMVGEHIAGSEESFVSKMNERAKSLGMHDTHFVNCTGLDAEGHVTSAYDIALMSRALLAFDDIRNYTTIWTDTIRNGAFGLSNTNKLVRFYNGSTGLKTGFTSDAGYCISASAMRDNMELIAVIMKSDTSANRNADASVLLNYGFSQYAMYIPELSALSPVKVMLGKETAVLPQLSKQPAVLVKKNDINRISVSVECVSSVSAPVEIGQTLGRCFIRLDDRILSEIPILASSSVEKKSVKDLYGDYLSRFLMRNIDEKIS